VRALIVLHMMISGELHSVPHMDKKREPTFHLIKSKGGPDAVAAESITLKSSGEGAGGEGQERGWTTSQAQSSSSQSS
jgi:hypothetical protein